MSSLTFEGTTIKSNSDDLICLTDMWKASGKDKSSNPYDWRRKEGAKIINQVCLELNTPVERVMEVRQGKGGGTYAIKKLALAYAEYLSPAMHYWMLSLVQGVIEADVEIAIDIARRNQDPVKANKLAKESANQAIYLDGYWGVHNKLKERDCQNIHHATVNKCFNEFCQVEKGKRNEMDERQKATMIAAQYLAVVALIDNPSAKEWKAVNVAKQVTKLLPVAR